MKDLNWNSTIEWVRVVAGCVVYENERYLMVCEKQPKAYGLWNLPAGHVDKGESFEVAAIRETEEETGYSVSLVRKLAVYHHDISAPVKHVYIAKLVGGVNRGESSEILEVKWLDYNEIKNLYESDLIRSKWVWLAIEDHRKLLKTSVEL